ncbi:MAG: ArsR family transcriptional regulator [Kiritimatiellales bacterium]
MKNSPSLWNLCRVIANKPRLKLLQLLFENGELCVSDAQVKSGMSRTNTSNQLKVLYASGLISFRRKEMNVIYRAEPVFPDGFPSRFLNAIRICFSQGVPASEMIWKATGFSHGRRIEVVRAIDNAGGSFEMLQKKTGMSRAALFRHLDKLERRDFVCHQAGVYRRCSPKDVFAKALLDAVLS